MNDNSTNVPSAAALNVLKRREIERKRREASRQQLAQVLEVSHKSDATLSRERVCAFWKMNTKSRLVQAMCAWRYGQCECVSCFVGGRSGSVLPVGSAGRYGPCSWKRAFECLLDECGMKHAEQASADKLACHAPKHFGGWADGDRCYAVDAHFVLGGNYDWVHFGAGTRLSEGGEEAMEKYAQLLRRLG